jgi:hypothetical protein
MATAGTDSSGGAEAIGGRTSAPNVGVKPQITAQRLFVGLNELLGAGAGNNPAAP